VGVLVRRAARQDGNHGAIVEALRAVGVSVTDTSGVGGGFPDICAGYRNRVYLIEIKDPTQPPSKRKFTPDQRKWHTEWKGGAHLVESVEQAFMVVGIPARLRA
jgi:hypothetical protein